MLLVALAASAVQQVILAAAGVKWVAFLGIGLGSLGEWRLLGGREWRLPREGCRVGLRAAAQGCCWWPMAGAARGAAGGWQVHGLG